MIAHQLEKTVTGNKGKRGMIIKRFSCQVKEDQLLVYFPSGKIKIDIISIKTHQFPDNGIKF